MSIPFRWVCREPCAARGKHHGIVFYRAGDLRKRLALLKEIIPKLSRVAVLWNPQNPAPQRYGKKQLAAKVLGLQLHSMAVYSSDKFESAFKEAVKAQSGALIMTGGGLIGRTKTDRRPRGKESAADDIQFRRNLWNGGLMSYGHDEIEHTGGPRLMSTRFLKAPSPPIYRWSSQRSSSW